MKTTHYPTVKGSIGDWTYYVTVMSVSDVVLYVRFAEQVVPNEDLDMMIQREVSARSRQIAEYLRTQDQRFFGSLIVAAYDGEPRFLPVAFSDAPVLSQLEGKLGILQFDGSEQYYVVDGQHRLAALKEVLKEDSDRYEGDELSVIVICHAKDAEGMARARRLFTTVNRYAKKTSPVTNIIMDEDDGMAIITRRLIREDQFFTNRVKVLIRQPGRAPKLATGEAMQQSDKRYLMAVGTLYKCNWNLLPADLQEFFKNKQQLPEYDRLEEAFTSITRRWDGLVEAIAVWRTLREPEADVEQLRTENGGHILARPIGIASFTKAAGEALDLGVRSETIADSVEHFSDLNQAPWAGLLWNTASNRMLAGKARENLASKIWRFLLNLPTDYNALNAEWRAEVDPRDQHAELNLPNPHRP
jgi:DNA sulfur modification protein DndB